MIYAFALLFFILALVTGFPAVWKLLRMHHINKNAGSTSGHVTSVASALGWLWTSSFGNVTRPIIKYETPSGTEMVLEVVASSMFTFRFYEIGTPVEVVFDRSSPGDAYARPEWDANLRDLRTASLALLFALTLNILGRLFHL